MTEPVSTVTHSFAFALDNESETSARAQREEWANETFDTMKRLGLQAVFCRTRNGSPIPMEGTTGGADFGVFEMPSKAHTRPALRPPIGAILLDVDQKPGKASDGYKTLCAAEAELGFLPDTQRLTAHGFEQKSGRMLFRVPEWLHVDESFFSQFGGSIDVIRTGHRFSMAPGDIHPGTGTTVVCYGPDGSVEELLPVQDWPALPVDWVLALSEWADTRGTAAKLSGLDDDDDGGLERVVAEHEAKAMVENQLSRILTHDTTGSGFRAKLLGASMTLGGFVGTLYPDADTVTEALQEAVSKVWGAEPDSDDLTMILSGVSKGALSPWVIAGGEVENAEDDDTPSDVGTPKLPPVTLTDAVQATAWLREEIGRNGMSGLFLRSGQLVKVVEAPLAAAGRDGVVAHDGFQQISVLDKPNQLRSYAQMSGYRFYTKGGKETAPKPILLNAEAAGVCIDTPEGLPNARTLRGVTGTPIIRADGTILDTPGYDDASQLLYKPDSDELVVPWVKEAPDADDVRAARDLLEYIVVDVPFVNDNNRANYFGALMLPLLRVLVPPPYKLVAIDAHTPGSGKTLLADVMRAVHHGKPDGSLGGAFRSEWPKREEFSKWVTSVLLNGAGGIVHVDNVKSTLAGGELEGLLTNASYGGRLLGRSEQVRVPNDRLWVVTGNNIAIGGDMARRVLWARIDPGEENPERRGLERFQETDLVGFVIRNRGRIIHAVLTLARAWYVAGAKLAPATSSDSYSRSTQVIQGILDHAGIVGTFDPVEERVASQDQDDTALFLEALYAWQEERESKGVWPAADLARAINDLDFGSELRDFVPDHWWGGRGVLSSQSLGKRLHTIMGAPHNGLRLSAEMRQDKKQAWIVHKL